MLCADETGNFSWLLTVNFINESVYWHEIGGTYNRLLHEFLVVIIHNSKDLLLYLPLLEELLEK